MPEQNSKPVAAVIGVGPGLGAALVRRFAADGYAVACVARRDAAIRSLADEVAGKAFSADATDPGSLRTALSAIRDTLGPVHTLLWNVGSGVFGDIDQLEPSALELALGTNAEGLFVAVKDCLPDLRACRGNVIVTGATASLRGKPFTTAFAAGKAAQRSLAESLARTLWPDGVHVALIIVDGMVDIPATRQRFPDRPDGAFISPDAYADTAAFLCRQHPSAWTFQLEVRPSVETW
jgi:NAD(P)-dependent dehydrogenase (short-subunit alcohol dehydrogenase family)